MSHAPFPVGCPSSGTQLADLRATLQQPLYYWWVPCPRAQRAAGGETEDESLAAQMRMLRLRVPRYFHPNGVAARATNARANEQTDDASTTADFVRVWPWEAATAEDLANLSPSYGIGTMASAESWEMVHLALLKTTFVPLMMERVKTMSRRSRRVYERTFDLERTFVSVDDIDDVHEGDFSA